jgi:AmiR/NasT family two-component response regulator
MRTPDIRGVATDEPSTAEDTAKRLAEVTQQLERARAEIEGLRQALVTCRCIGMAIGIVMERQRITSAEAFDVLRSISTRTHRKIRDVAEDVVFSGELPAGPSR